MKTATKIKVKINIISTSYHQRSTFFLIIAEFGCVRLSTHYRIWLYIINGFRTKSVDIFNFRCKFVTYHILVSATSFGKNSQILNCHQNQ